MNSTSIQSSFIRAIFAVFLSGVIFISCSRTNVSTVNRGQKQSATNVILLIGDGMGLSQITGGMISNGMKTNLEKYPFVGLHKSHAYDNLITDSAAGATAFSCGKKTYNGAIAVDPNRQPMKTILEEANEKGLKTGLVATSTIVHATPASFFAHNVARKNYEEIALDFLNGQVDIFIGGGKKFFDRREDGRDLYQELIAENYQISDYFKEDLEDVEITGEKFGFLTSDNSPLTIMQGRDYLSKATQMTLDFLKQKSTKGFFLMVESSQIDWGGHSNNGEYIVEEFKEFDKVIGEVLDFARRDGNTLVVVTADHETGGFAINPGTRRDSLVTAFTTDYHTGSMIPVFAYGPGSERFSGIYENTAIYDKMKSAFGW